MDMVKTLKKFGDVKDLAFAIIGAKSDANAISVAESYIDRGLGWLTAAAQGKASMDRNLDADAAQLRRIIDGGYRREDIDAARARLRETSASIQAEAARIEAKKSGKG
ncbi:hypothetical protein [Hyphomonas sp.]|uniref:hypothetical protein n=1 Tax=Hyphomonas sp. TaxID=87 RepID=UPI00391B82D3